MSQASNYEGLQYFLRLFCIRSDFKNHILKNYSMIVLDTNFDLIKGANEVVLLPIYR